MSCSIYKHTLCKCKMFVNGMENILSDAHELNHAGEIIKYGTCQAIACDWFAFIIVIAFDDGLEKTAVLEIIFMLCFCV